MLMLQSVPLYETQVLMELRGVICRYILWKIFLMGSSRFVGGSGINQHGLPKREQQELIDQDEQSSTSQQPSAEMEEQ